MIVYPEENKLTTEQLFRLTDIHMAESERLEGWGMELVGGFPPITDYRERVYLGSFAWTLMKSKKRLIITKHARQLGEHHVTPADLARGYLRIKYANRRKSMTKIQAQEFIDYRSQTPLYCAPCNIQDALYIDLKSAYWSIVQAIGWDVEYYPNGWLGAGQPVTDFPFADDKMARNCLVSVGLPASMSVWTGNKLITQKGKNDFINLMLWGAVCDILNGVAADAIKAGAVYVYTDGYIVPSNRANDVFDAIEQWGLPFGIKYMGKCEVRAPANYRFPEHRTRLYDDARYIHYDKIIDRGGHWLRKKFRAFAEKRIHLD